MNAQQLQVFVIQFGRLLEALAREHAHVQITIVLKNGEIQPVHINRSFSPENLPKV
jgi:hypothetical protein